MEQFKITINGVEYRIKAELHDNFYSVSCENKSAMLGKNDDGQWKISMQTSEAIENSAEEIGKAIESYQSGRNESP